MHRRLRYIEKGVKKSTIMVCKANLCDPGPQGDRVHFFGPDAPRKLRGSPAEARPQFGDHWHIQGPMDHISKHLGESLLQYLLLKFEGSRPRMRKTVRDYRLSLM